MKRILPTLALTLAASPALAHLDPNEHGSVMAGLSHPVFGLDHILAMVAVGLWAVSLGGRAIVALPAAFVGAMILGYFAAVAGVPLPFVEPMILVSVFALGLALAFAFRLPVWAAATAVGFFGLFHGHAHGGELGSAGALAFGIGFAISTALLHAFGVVVAIMAGRALRGANILRGLGVLTALGGLWVVVAG
ncbi:HupE/UreJ family protein [Maritimibacter sp. DP1N21-5]|uniref:HupE/UreJ family protein n=1 Tax=Maritimibacter sp. DP1N21-5 TaxID=2836867 RepID=UPI001C495123|nr:HupE/UreJ family protein [Maritimibacter sp. DP1N21-5]MBV7408371.1 HupE/UreJ family protein [Maritimibacter sp. DP1N21-5]